MDVIARQIYTPTVGKSKCWYALSEMLYFYDLQKDWYVSCPERNFVGHRTELFKTHKIGNVPGKPGPSLCTGVLRNVVG